MMKQSLVILSAPSGCGKDTIAQKVCERLEGVGVAVSATTRPPRRKQDGSLEKHGADYYFLSQEEFEERIRENGFLEYADVKGTLYGTPRSEMERLGALGKDVVLLIIEERGAVQIMAAEPTAVSVFILPPDAQELRRRLVGRGSETAEEIEKRMKKSEEQMKIAYAYDYVVMNDELEQAVEQVVHIISAVRCRTLLHKALIDQVNRTF